MHMLYPAICMHILTSVLYHTHILITPIYILLYNTCLRILYYVYIHIYSMLVGTLPFDRHGGDLNLTLQQVASGVYERPAHVSVEGLDLLDKLLDVVSVGVYVDDYNYYYYHSIITK